MGNRLRSNLTMLPCVFPDVCRPLSNCHSNHVRIDLFHISWVSRPLMPLPAWFRPAIPNCPLRKTWSSPPILTIDLLILPILAKVIVVTILWLLVLDLFWTYSTAWSVDLAGLLLSSSVVDRQLRFESDPMDLDDLCCTFRWLSSFPSAHSIPQNLATS